MPMQPLLDYPRQGLTEQQVIDIVQNSASVTMSAGMELVDLDLNVLEDISDDLVGGSVERNSYNTLHATGNFRINRPLDWGAALIRPYVVMTAGGVSAQFYLGVYHPSTPARSAAESPPVYDVQAYDLLLRLNDPVGDTYVMFAGDNYLAKVEEILQLRGFTQYIIDQTAWEKTATAARTWQFDDNITWLSIVNDMLGAVGYAGIWSDWLGRLRCEPYILPVARAVEWSYSDDQYTSMLGVDRTVVQDFFDTPNRWVAYKQSSLDEAAPVEGAGKFIYVNQSVGETSVDARGGRVITRVQGFDVADQGALEAKAWEMIQADMDVPTTYTVPVFPNPLHWHFDRLFVSDSSLLPYADVQCTSWTFTLPPDIDDMQQTWTILSR